MPIAEYLKEVNKRYKTGISREHSYRGDLQTLVESLVTGIIATNEPARISCGAPDYVITKNNIPLGYIEAKDLDDDFVFIVMVKKLRQSGLGILKTVKLLPIRRIFKHLMT